MMKQLASCSREVEWQYNSTAGDGLNVGDLLARMS